VTSLLAHHGVVAVFVLMAIDAVFPAASELVMLYGGALASGALAHELDVFGTPKTGTSAYLAIALAGTIGYLLGALVGWAIGFYGGRGFLERRGRWFRLDERRLALDFGISRTPVREAMAQLEREGFVRAVPRRGIYVVRKTKREVIEMITAWAALEGMAARLITESAGAGEIASLRTMFAKFENGELHARLDEYSEVNIEFHQTIIRMSRNSVLISLAENLLTHMRMIRRKTIGEQDRADRSIRDHLTIIEALEARDTKRAEDLVRNHALGLAEHVAKYADYLD